ncbi:hypothetical protein UA08_00997 [Talaromyces atroroseus]|uniref:Enoyl reductase (ER) domain-containing protein n=1 Tax=Talaromyces atroroseus TaxID=1441469 RepID=A0A225BEK2_TALAT|nr:hypothetical protein UA08_00997 [Talaromyces atroroseus]OKL64467.1 hypothetical protein UA08_00997 [Talaromyces atroroseus]
MQSYHINTYSTPQGYELGQLPRPEIENADEVLIKVHAASVNPIDVKMASGAAKMIISLKFPYKPGYDCAGTVVEVGSQVTRFKVGDEVYTRLPESTRGSWSEYAKSPEEFLALKPKNLTFEEAASIPLTALTAFQSLQVAGDLSGKTVFVPAGLSGTGAYFCQLAKNVFKADKVITTVSTAKIPKVPELLGEGVVDQIIDYTKSDPKAEIPAGSVDLMFDTLGLAMDYLSLIRPQTGYMISISTTPSGDQFVKDGNLEVPFVFRKLLNFADSARTWRASRWGVTYKYVLMRPNGRDLEQLKDQWSSFMMKDAHEEAISAVSNFYKVITKLAYIDPAALVYPPGSSEATDITTSGWPNINTAELRKRGKTDEVITLLRYLPYLRRPESPDSKRRWMVAPDTIAIAYCDGEVYSDQLDEIQPTPGHCIWLADPAGTENGVALLLDMENSTITEYSVRIDRTIGLSTDEYELLSLEDRWMAHFTWPIAKFFDTWTQKYERLEWMPAYHDSSTAGTAVWFISPTRGEKDVDREDEEGDSEDSDESYEPSSEDSDDDYESEEDSDPYEWDSEYESEDEYELSDDEGQVEASREESVANDYHQSKSESLNWFRQDVGFQVRMGDGKSLDPKRTDLRPEEVVEKMAGQAHLIGNAVDVNCQS